MIAIRFAKSELVIELQRRPIVGGGPANAISRPKSASYDARLRGAPPTDAGELERTRRTNAELVAELRKQVRV